MKRVALTAVLISALVLGVVAYAVAAPGDPMQDNVSVTATVNPQITLTIDDGVVAWTATPGVAAAASGEIFTVKSNKPWNFTFDSVTYTPDDGLLDAVLSESYAGDFAPADTGIAKGVSTMTATYSLDMLGDAAYELDPTVSYGANYLYTAAQ